MTKHHPTKFGDPGGFEEMMDAIDQWGNEMKESVIALDGAVKPAVETLVTDLYHQLHRNDFTFSTSRLHIATAIIEAAMVIVRAEVKPEYKSAYIRDLLHDLKYPHSHDELDRALGILGSSKQ